MSFNLFESSIFGSKPFELFWIRTTTQEWCLTSGRTARQHIGKVFQPDTVLRSTLKQGEEATSGGLDIELAKNHAIAGLFVSSLPVSPLLVTVFQGHHGDTEVITRFTGRVHSAEFGQVCKLKCLPSQASKRRIPTWLYQQQCGRIHYSPECGAILSANTWPVLVTAVHGTTISGDFSAAWTGTRGRLQFGFLAASGRRMMIVSNPDSSTIVLKAPAPWVAVGDVIEVSAGCRRTYEDCAVFGRLSSYMAFDQIPNRNPFLGLY